MLPVIHKKQITQYKTFKAKCDPQSNSMGPDGGTVTLTMTMILKQCLWECLTAAALEFTVEGEASACS